MRLILVLLMLFVASCTTSHVVHDAGLVSGRNLAKVADIPLIEASGRGDIAAVKELLSTPSEINVNAENNEGFTALMAAGHYGHAEVAQLLLQNSGIDVNHQNRWGFTALRWASSSGHTKVVEILLKADGIDATVRDSNGNTALMVAARMGHFRYCSNVGS